MPTGYTSKLHDGKEPQSFQEFVLSCARSFGALIEMRDDPMDAPIPDEFKPDSYHADALKDAKAALARLQAMSESDANLAAKKDNAIAVYEHKQSELRNKERLARYKSMLLRVLAWQPPTADHGGLKDFMVQQINESIRMDCARYPLAKPRTGARWLADALRVTEGNVAYHTKGLAEEGVRAKERTEWIRSLRDSLKGEQG